MEYMGIGGRFAQLMLKKKPNGGYGGKDSHSRFGEGSDLGSGSDRIGTVGLKIGMGSES